MKKFAITILLTFTIVTVSSCMKKPDHTPDFGPEATIEEINSTLKIDMPLMPETIALGQVVSIDQYQVIDTGNPLTVYQRSDNVTGFASSSPNNADAAYCWVFTVHAKQLDFKTGEMKASIDKYGPLAYPSPTAIDCSGLEAAPQTLNQLISFNVNSNATYRPLTLPALKANDAQKKTKTTYHKLKREDVVIPVPQTVSASENWCGTNPDSKGKIRACKKELRLVILSFDQVEWPENEKPFKVSYKMSFSSDVPTYVSDWSGDSLSLSNQLESCYQYWQEFKNGEVTQNAPVRVCKELVKFQFGIQTLPD